jgi:hypothetical protein
MHPYQDQINRMWSLIKLRIRAIKQGYWLEVIDLTYIILEIELRLLLTSKARKQGKPLSTTEINEQKYLMSLANLASNKGFLDDSLLEKIRDFNNKRRDAIHGLAQGRISYFNLEDVYKNTTELIYNIQNRWLPISYGPEET